MLYYMDHFVDMFEPAPENFWIPVVNENHIKAYPQQQQRHRPQLFRTRHSHHPNGGIVDNWCMGACRSRKCSSFGKDFSHHIPLTGLKCFNAKGRLEPASNIDPTPLANIPMTVDS